MQSKTILITGATAGIGKACAQRYAAKKHRLILTGRRKERLEELQHQLIAAHEIEVHIAAFDVQDNNQVEAFFANLPDAWKNIDILVNNAGLALGVAPIDAGKLEHWEQMIDTNIKGLLYVSRQAIPLLKKSTCAHIVNISSIAGRETYRNGNVYCATKHAVQSLSDAMRIDLLHHGIKVTSICPGAVETEFSIVRYEGDINAAKKVYANYEPLVAEDIADAVQYATSRPKHVSISDLLITPSVQANTANFLK